MAEVRLLGERVEEGERKRGWRKRKEENGVQAPNRAEIILDHKGWNSRKSKDILRICQSIVEKGKEARWTRRWSRGSGPSSYPWWWRRGSSGPTCSPWWWQRPPHSLTWAERRVNDTLSLIFFWKTQVHLWMWWRNGEQLEDVGRRTPMRRCEVEERISITELCCVWHSFYTLKKEKWPFMNLAAVWDQKFIRRSGKSLNLN